MTAGSARVALMTAPDEAVAERIVRRLVDERIIACGSIVPGLTSIYRWKGGVERDDEVLVVLKTTAAAVPALLARVPELHPYDVPELLVTEVLEGHGPYLAWLDGSVSAMNENEP